MQVASTAATVHPCTESGIETICTLSSSNFRKLHRKSIYVVTANTGELWSMIPDIFACGAVICDWLEEQH